MLRPTLALLALAAPSAASAHIVMSPNEAAAGGYYAGAFRVSHGCAGSATTVLRMEIPPALTTVRPQLKPGWTIAIERRPLAQPVRQEDGRMLTQGVAAITWRGRLEDAYFDTFGLSMKLPAAAGPLHFPVVQTCEQGETRWTERAAEGAAWNSVPHPAPVLTVAPAAPADPHAGHR